MQSILDRFENSRFWPAGRPEMENTDEWVAAGKPHEWVKVEEANGYVGWVDFGHGLVALTKGDKLIDAGKSSVQSDNCVLLDRDYYGVKKYLWF